MDPVTVLLWIAVVAAGMAALVLLAFVGIVISSFFQALGENRRKQKAVTEAAERVLRRNG